MAELSAIPSPFCTLGISVPHRSHLMGSLVFALLQSLLDHGDQGKHQVGSGKGRFPFRHWQLTQFYRRHTAIPLNSGYDHTGFRANRWHA